MIIDPSVKAAVLYDELFTSWLDESKDRLRAVKEKKLKTIDYSELKKILKLK